MKVFNQTKNMPEIKSGFEKNVSVPRKEHIKICEIFLSKYSK
jgi:hypothetical protein